MLKRLATPYTNSLWKQDMTCVWIYILTCFCRNTDPSVEERHRSTGAFACSCCVRSSSCLVWRQGWQWVISRWNLHREYIHRMLPTFKNTSACSLEHACTAAFMYELHMQHSTQIWFIFCGLDSFTAHYIHVMWVTQYDNISFAIRYLQRCKVQIHVQFVWERMPCAEKQCGRYSCSCEELCMNIRVYFSLFFWTILKCVMTGKCIYFHGSLPHPSIHFHLSISLQRNTRFTHDTVMISVHAYDGYWSANIRWTCS